MTPVTSGESGPSGPSNSGESGVLEKSTAGDSRWAASDGRAGRGLQYSLYIFIRCSPGESGSSDPVI